MGGERTLRDELEDAVLLALADCSTDAMLEILILENQIMRRSNIIAASIPIRPLPLYKELENLDSKSRKLLIAIYSAFPYMEPGVLTAFVGVVHEVKKMQSEVVDPELFHVRLNVRDSDPFRVDES